jgi:hypothetical protein
MSDSTRRISSVSNVSAVKKANVKQSPVICVPDPVPIATTVSPFDQFG